jgi:hypothetical protein
MPCCSDLADYQWLAGSEVAVVLRDLADCTAAAVPVHVAASRLRRQFSAERVHLLLEQVALRRRAAAKFARPQQMFFTRLGLEQATDQWVARYKAQRFAGRGPLADLCCGIGGDLLALAENGPTDGVDRDPIATCLAAANVRAILSSDVADRVSLQTSQIERFDAGVFAAWHLDPDRRPAGSRTTSLGWSSPNLQEIERLIDAAPNAAVKLAPAADVPATWTERWELEWISRDRQCRQLVAWHGELAVVAGRHRATVLAPDGQVRRIVVGANDAPAPLADRLGDFIFEPDPAVLAAHLAGALAAEHDLAAISPGIAYLTGAEPIGDPALACFAVDEVLPLKLRQLAQHLRARGIGRLEIKKRGVDHDPQQVRRALDPCGEESATLILTKLNGKHVAVLARRVPSSASVASLTSDLRPPTSTHAACL